MVKKNSYHQEDVTYGFWTEICLFTEKITRRDVEDWSSRLSRSAERKLEAHFAKSDRELRRLGQFACIVTTHRKCCRRYNRRIDTLDRLSILEQCNRGVPIAIYRAGSGKLRAQESATKRDYQHAVENAVRDMLMREYRQSAVRAEFGKARSRRRETFKLWRSPREFNFLANSLFNSSCEMVPHYGEPTTVARQSNGSASGSGTSTADSSGDASSASSASSSSSASSASSGSQS